MYFLRLEFIVHYIIQTWHSPLQTGQKEKVKCDVTWPTFNLIAILVSDLLYNMRKENISSYILEILNFISVVEDMKDFNLI